MKTADISPAIIEKSPLILAEIEKASSVLLHCHPSPDPDSVGSALAMKFALESMGKKATVIKGDSDIPQAFMHFPGAKDIVQKNYFEIDLKQFDLFIVLDSGANGISRLKPVELPRGLKVINIDHHRTNPGCGSVNLIVSGISSCCELLADLFQEWDVDVTADIARNLFIGMYTDTGGFKYEGTTAHTFAVASMLTAKALDFHKLISRMENSDIPATIAFKGAAFDSVSTFLNGKVALACVPVGILTERGIPASEAGAGMISASLRSVGEWAIVGALIETEKNKIKLSFRSNDADMYDVSKLAADLGGGGHRAAAGATLDMPLDEAKKLVVAKAKELYNL